MKERLIPQEVATTNLLEPWITWKDLVAFKNELLADLKELYPAGKREDDNKWLKSYQVREMLSISPGTLQTLRNNGTLPYTKIGGALYYDFKDIKSLLDKAKIDKAKNRR